MSAARIDDHSLSLQAQRRSKSRIPARHTMGGNNTDTSRDVPWSLQKRAPRLSSSRMPFMALSREIRKVGSRSWSRVIEPMPIHKTLPRADRVAPGQVRNMLIKDGISACDELQASLCFSIAITSSHAHAAASSEAFATPQALASFSCACTCSHHCAHPTKYVKSASNSTQRSLRMSS
jgi:hypothetical protein